MKSNPRHEICLAAFPLQELGEWDNRIFKKDAAHSYLLIRNADTGHVLGEFHGYCYCPNDNMFQFKSSSMRQLRNLVKDFGYALVGSVKGAVTQDKTSYKLKTYAVDHDWRTTSKESDVIPLVTMNENTAINLMNRFARIMVGINHMDIDYCLWLPRGCSSNCHMVSDMLVDQICAEIPQAEAPVRAGVEQMLEKYAMPGMTSRIGDHVLNLPEFHARKTGFGGSLVKSIRQLGVQVARSVSDSFMGWSNISHAPEGFVSEDRAMLPIMRKNMGA
jgi:hypothetical protein